MFVIKYLWMYYCLNELYLHAIPSSQMDSAYSSLKTYSRLNCTSCNFSLISLCSVVNMQDKNHK